MNDMSKEGKFRFTNSYKPGPAVGENTESKQAEAEEQLLKFTELLKTRYPDGGKKEASIIDLRRNNADLMFTEAYGWCRIARGKALRTYLEEVGILESEKSEDKKGIISEKMKETEDQKKNITSDREDLSSAQSEIKNDVQVIEEPECRKSEAVEEEVCEEPKAIEEVSTSPVKFISVENRMLDVSEQEKELFAEMQKLRDRYELSKTIEPDYFEPGMMEYPEQSYGSYDEAKREMVLRFESRGIRYEGRTERIENVHLGDEIRIVRDPENQFNQNNFRVLDGRNTDLGNMPATLCNALAPLYDAGIAVIQRAEVSYVEPISKRSRHARQAIMFVEMTLQLRDETFVKIEDQSPEEAEQPQSVSKHPLNEADQSKSVSAQPSNVVEQPMSVATASEEAMVSDNTREEEQKKAWFNISGTKVVRGYVLDEVQFMNVSGRNFASTGLADAEEAQVINYLGAHGAVYKKDMSRKVDCLIVNTAYEYKTKKYLEASKLRWDGNGPVLISWEDFLALAKLSVNVPVDDEISEAEQARKKLHLYYAKRTKTDKSAYGVMNKMKTMSDEELIELAEDKKLLHRNVKSNDEGGKFIFISYAHKDMKKVQPILERMQRDGYRIWYDEGIEPGKDWADVLAQKMDSSSVFIAMISENYLGSENCTNELNYSLDISADTILVYLDNARLKGGLQLNFGRKQAIRSEGMFREDFYEKLYSAEYMIKLKEENDL